MSAFGGKADMALVGQNVRRNSDLRIAFMFAETIKLIVEFTLIISVSQTRNAILIICGALLASAGLIDTPANAQKRLEAQYRITMTGVPVGKIIWQVEFANNLYTMSASGGANGVVSLLINKWSGFDNYQRQDRRRAPCSYEFHIKHYR